VVSPDGTRVYVIADDTATGASTVSVIDTATFTAIGAPIPVGSKAAALAVSPDGTRVYVSNGAAGTVSVIDTATDTIVGAPITVGPDLVGLAVSPDGTRLYVAGGEPAFGYGTLSVVDTTTNKIIGSPIKVGEYDDYGGAGAVAVSPDGKHVYVTGYTLGGKVGDVNRLLIGSVMVIDAATNTLTASIVVGSSNPTALAVSPDGTRVYVTGSDFVGTGSVTVIDTATNTTIGTPIKVGYDLTSSGAVGPDGRRVYVTGATLLPLPTSMTVIDTATNFAVGAPIKFGFDTPLGVAVSPDGTRIYVTHANPFTLTGAVSVIDPSILDQNSAPEKQFESFYRDTGWIPIWGSVLSAAGLVFDIGQLVTAVATGNAYDIADEAGDLVGDALGIGLGLLPWGTRVATGAGHLATQLVAPTI
jgi:YVTN family beta-propeller protein